MLQIKQFTFSPVAENTYVLYNEAGQACIIDPGCYGEAEEQMLARFVEAKQLQPVALLLTHAHLDHVFGLRWAAARYKLVPRLHRNEEMVLQYAPIAGERWGLPFGNYAGPLEWVAEGDEIHLGEDRLRVLEAPGHAPGHVCYYCEAQGFVIGGDVLFAGSIGRTDLPGANHAVLLQSIREKLFTLPDDTVVHPGHGESTTIGVEKRTNPFLV